jgi:hypothetical protein
LDQAVHLQDSLTDTFAMDLPEHILPRQNKWIPPCWRKALGLIPRPAFVR